MMIYTVNSIIFFGASFSVMFGVACILMICIERSRTISKSTISKSKARKRYFQKSAEEFVNGDIHNQGLHHQTTVRKVFIDGAYYGHYKQYGRKYTMRSFELQFNNNIVCGCGVDSVGSYLIKGIYSEKTQRMSLNKTYIEGTGNPEENLGHTVRVRLEYDTESNQFIGKWCVKTLRYNGNGVWIISKLKDYDTTKRIKLH